MLLHTLKETSFIAIISKRQSKLFKEGSVSPFMLIEFD